MALRTSKDEPKQEGFFNKLLIGHWKVFVEKATTHVSVASWFREQHEIERSFLRLPHRSEFRR